jgi:hypothetical protein
MILGIAPVRKSSIPGRLQPEGTEEGKQERKEGLRVDMAQGKINQMTITMWQLRDNGKALCGDLEEDDHP